MSFVSGTFGGTGTSATCFGTAIDVSIEGIASSTVLVQRRIGDNWRTIETVTADGERVVENATGLEHRLNCSVYGSGTITYAMVSR